MTDSATRVVQVWRRSYSRNGGNLAIPLRAVF